MFIRIWRPAMPSVPRLGSSSWWRLSLALFALLVGICAPLSAQNAPNSDPTYQALRNVALGSESVEVNDLYLRRDAATFHLRSGTICFAAAVQGKVTGALFVGDGSLALAVPPSEVDILKLLTKESEFNENFSQMVLRFTDSTYDEIKKTAKPGAGNCDAGTWKDSQRTTRDTLKNNLEIRILEDILANQPGGLFVAFVRGKRYSDKELFTIDPRQSGDQVQFVTYGETKAGLWASFRLSGEHQRGTVGIPVSIEHQQLDTTLEGNGNLTGKATTTFRCKLDGVRVVPFDLFPSLRVRGVTAEGQQLSFIQENKDRDAQFAVILPKTLMQGESFTLTTEYSGKEAVRNEGNGNFFPVSRENWFPNNPQAEFAEYVSYDMTFRIPKAMRIAATGALVSENGEGGQDVTVWKSETPQTIAGFNFGKFKVEEAKLTNPDFFVQSFANEEPPNWVQSLREAASGDILPGVAPRGPGLALGTMNTTLLNKKALAEGEFAVRIYNDYFGPSLFKHLQITQQTACNFGQSWPGLVWIPICYYFDTTVRHELGMDYGDRGYWKVVTPHEVAHQWWGHTVGFNSYRDQWMSEGFADMSASLYLMFTDKSHQQFLTFWNDERSLLLERNAEGFRAIDAGPLTLGYRTSNSRTGFDVTRRLIYPKGAYVLHMLRMMMFDGATGDQQFKEMMRDFVKTYSGSAATTENFKAMVEKHMTRDMDLDGTHTMDWFFNEYVYGTQLPSYQADFSFGAETDQGVLLNLKLTQSNVDGHFAMLVPIYLETADGNIVRLGRAKMAGNSSIEVHQPIPLKGLKAKPRRVFVNYNDDVLASPN